MNKSKDYLRKPLIAAMILFVTAGVLVGAREAVRILKPVSPGVHYPANPRELYAAVTQYLNDATVEPRIGRLTAVVAPCSLYSLSGRIAAHDYKLLKPGQYDRVVVLTPSHYATFRGCSVASVQYYRTPLGDVPVDGASIRRLTWCPLFDIRSVVYRQELYQRGERTPLHEVEHGIEVQLPFLQIQLGEFTLVPVVVGTLTDHAGNFDGNGLNLIVKHLKGILGDRTLLVVSTNLTLYGPEYGYVPFRGDVVRELGKLDMELLDLILDRDVSGLLAYTKRTGNNFPGVVPILIMLGVLPPEARGTVLAYDTTARMSPGASSSVSFASVAFFDPQAKPPEEKPVRTLVSPKPQEEPAPPTAEATDAPASP
ncbi:MAG TPA: AmmeMemoRadiSam system protein B [Candidatus Hydrogenedentes bacterium]|nr:AmmeMemoRadiSam system protein B [Candidatus Hydrogenedentota bacterium]HOL77489.1 AmmeMemoRadiSam system protein B [Candidatus Hydrogenedentota bacterium]HPO86264.1 AmmeMemoRadiSam system protein B [Candidatus Hydrogenedentota bacterium]